MKKIGLKWWQLNRRKCAIYFAFLLLVVVEIAILFFCFHKWQYLIDSDMTSELILSKMLVDEHQLFLTPHWFYSTELRVLNTQIVYSFFFRLFDDWRLVRICSLLVFHLLIIASSFYFYYQLFSDRCPAMKKLTSVFGALSIILPFSHEYFYIVTFGAFYIPHIVFSILTIGAFFNFDKGKQRGIQQLFSICWVILLAFLTGLGGLRQIVITYLPLVLALSGMFLFDLISRSLVEKNRWKQFIIALVLLFCSGVGFLINKLYLSQHFIFSQWDNIHFTPFNWWRLGEIINDLLLTFGYRQDGLNLSTLFCNCLAIALLFLSILAVASAIRWRSNYRYHLLACFVMAAGLVYVGIYTLTDMPYAPRYVFPLIIFCWPLIILFLDSFIKNIKFYWVKIVFVCLGFAFLLLRGFLEFKALRFEVRYGEINDITSYLLTTDYRVGYGDFWPANIVVELTNGLIDFYAWDDYTQNIDDLYHWLQPIAHTQMPPSGKVFLIISRDQLQHHPWLTNVRYQTPLFQTHNYWLYGFDSYETFKTQVMISPSATGTAEVD